MASKLSSDDFGEQFLTCPVCMLHFRDARILPCLHTFCKQCLQEWAGKQDPLECPTCRTQVSLPDQGVDGLKTNFYVNNLLDFAAVKKGAEPGVPCQVCEGNVEGSKSWCADCATLMCESCTAVHRKLPSTKDHEVTTEDTLKAESGVSKFQRKRHCNKHKNHELVFYCESCNALVCTACTVVDHRPGNDHNPIEISTVAQVRKETLQGLLQKIDPRMKEIEASIEEVDRKMSKINPSKDAVTNQAKTYFCQLADLLQNREKDILSQIEERCRVDSKGLQAKKEAIEFDLAELTSAQTFCQQAVEHGSDVHVVEVGNQVQTRVETLLTKQLDLESNWSELQFVENVPLVEFDKEVEYFGDLETDGDISKGKVVVKPAVRGFRCVEVSTTMSNKQKTRGQDISEQLETARKNREELETRVQDLAEQLRQHSANKDSTVEQMKQQHHREVKKMKGQVDNLAAQAQVAVRDREEKLKRLTQEISRMRKDMEEVPVLKAQADVLRQDFEAERQARQKAHHDMQTLEQQNRELQLENQQLRDEMEVYTRNALGEMQRRHVGAGQMNPPSPPANVPRANLPHMEYSGNYGYPRGYPYPAPHEDFFYDGQMGNNDPLQPVNMAQPRVQNIQQGALGIQRPASPDPEEKSCPKCNNVFPDLDTLQIHVMECLDYGWGSYHTKS